MLKNAIVPWLLLLVLVQLVALPADAQQDMPGGKWWQMPAVAKRLRLTDQEIQKLDEAFRQSRRQMIRLKADLETEQLELQSLIERPVLDEAAAMAQYDRLDKARAELGRARFRFFLEVRKIIGHERFNALMQFREMRRQRFRQESGRNPAAAD